MGDWDDGDVATAIRRVIGPPVKEGSVRGRAPAADSFRPSPYIADISEFVRVKV